MNKMKSWKLLSFVLIIYLIQTAYTAGITQDGNAVVGGSFTIECVTDSVVGVIQITDPSGNVAANCLIPSGTTSNCVPGTDPNYSSSQDVATKTTSVTIGVTDRATHASTWTCTKAGNTPFTTSVTVLTVPASITELTPAVTDFEVTTSISKTMTAVVECAYPSAQIDWEFVTETSASTGISPTRNTCTDMGLTGGACSDAAAKTFHCDFTVTETSTGSLSAGKYKLKANLYMDGEVTSTGISVELTPIITITATTTTPASSSSSSCDSCTPTYVLAALGIVVAVVCVALCWIMFFQLSESGGGKGKFECSVTWCFRATIIATVVSVIGFILCIAGLIICVTCDDSVSSSNSVTVGFALAVVGFVTLVIVIIPVILFCRGVITIKDDGQTINHVSVKNNDPLTLTCLAGDLATTLTWTGPGGILYVTGTTVQAGLSDTIKSRISASHTKGSYKLTFTEFRSSDKGTYTSTVDETVVKHEVIVQDNSPNLGDDTTEECVAMNSDPLLEEKANNPI